MPRLHSTEKQGLFPISSYGCKHFPFDNQMQNGTISPVHFHHVRFSLWFQPVKISGSRVSVIQIAQPRPPVLGHFNLWSALSVSLPCSCFCHAGSMLSVPSVVLLPGCLLFIVSLHVFWGTARNPWLSRRPAWSQQSDVIHLRLLLPKDEFLVHDVDRVRVDLNSNYLLSCLFSEIVGLLKTNKQKTDFFIFSIP